MLKLIFRVIAFTLWVAFFYTIGVLIGAFTAKAVDRIWFSKEA